jgi:hypothetical protein
MAVFFAKWFTLHAKPGIFAIFKFLGLKSAKISVIIRKFELKIKFYLIKSSFFLKQTR